MRFYTTFKEAQNEIARDLAELGVSVHTETMQDKDIKDDPDYETKELQNYAYTVTRPDYTDLEGVHEDWVKQEWADRLAGDLNPGRAWRKRPEVWKQFLEPKLNKFSYSYSERMGGRHILKAIDELLVHPNSRQIYIPVWEGRYDEDRRGIRRVPCSLGYHLMIRQGQLHLTYMMRSCDFFTHWANDAALANILQHYVAQQLQVQVGPFTHFIISFHVYKKDVADVF